MSKENLKVLCVLYDDPVDEFPPNYAREDIPKIPSYPDGQMAPTPEKIDFNPGELLGCVSGELGLRKCLNRMLFFGLVIVLIAAGILALVKGVKGDWDSKVKPEDMVGPSRDNRMDEKDSKGG